MTRRTARPSARARRDERGTTLVEVVAATAVLGVAVVAIGGLASVLGTTLAAVREPTVPAPVLAETVGRLARGAERVAAASRGAVVLEGAAGRRELVVLDDGALLVRGPEGEWTLGTEHVGTLDRIDHVTERGSRIELTPGEAHDGPELAEVVAIVVVDADGQDRLLVALRDRGGQ